MNSRMRNTRFTSFILIVGVLFHVGCTTEDASNVNQDRIYSTYELFYDANDDITYAKAQFKFSNGAGTALQLTGKGGVKFNGQDLSYDAGMGSYQKTIAGKTTTGTFVWTDTNGKTYSNSVSLQPIEFPSSVTQISRSGSYELFWTGEPLGLNETVTATIFYSSNGGLPQVALQSAQGSKSVIFSKAQLQALTPGTISISLDRSISPALSEKTSVGGTITGKYRSENKSVQLQ